MFMVHDPLSVMIGGVVSNLAVVSKCVAKSPHEYICVIIRLVPSHVVRSIPVLVLIHCPILYETRFPNSE